MYLQRTANAVYYSRVPVPRHWHNTGFPHTVRISLRTKERRVATRRNGYVSSAVQALFDDDQTFSSVESFQDRIEQLRSQVLTLSNPVASPASPIGTASSVSRSRRPARRTPSPRSPKRRKRKAVSITALIDQFLASKEKADVSTRYIGQLRSRLEPFVRFTAERRPLDQLTQKDAMAYRDVLLGNGWGYKTTKEYYFVAKQFFGWCVLMEHAPMMIFDNVKLGIKPTHMAHEQRREWTEAELEKLFAHPRFRDRKATSTEFWLPLLLLYSGLRPAEACQLAVKDIKHHGATGIWYVHVNDNSPGQKLKSPSARRNVPIHKALIKLGFIRYVTQRLQADHEMVFETHARGKHADFAKRPTDQFGKFLSKSLKFTPGNRPTAHSFRHTFVNSLKQAGAEEHIVAELVGHNHASITYGRYGKRMGLEALADIVNSLEFSAPRFILS